MSDEVLNINALKTLIGYVRQHEKQLPRLLSLHTLHLMAHKRALITFMISYELTSSLLLNLEDATLEV
jgi:hypothetical protein